MIGDTVRRVSIDETHGRRKTVSLVVGHGGSIVAVQDAMQRALGHDVSVELATDVLNILGDDTLVERLQ